MAFCEHVIALLWLGAGRVVAGWEWQWGGMVVGWDNTTKRRGRRISFASGRVKVRGAGWHWLGHDDRVLSARWLPLQNAFHGLDFFPPGGKPYLSFAM